MLQCLKKIVCFTLVVAMLAGVLPASASAVIDAPLTGSTGSGWDDFGGRPGEIVFESHPDYGTSDSNGSGVHSPGLGAGGGSPGIGDLPTVGDGVSNPDLEEAALPEPEEFDPNAALENPLAEIVFMESWIQDYQQAAASWAAQRNAGSPTVTNITWGAGAVSDRIVFSGGQYLGSPLPRITFQGEPAFCYEWNGQSPVGDYSLGGEGTNPRIRQILANFLASNRNREHYIATQILIWTELLGSSVASWGTSGVTQAHINAISNGTATPVPYIWFGGGNQNILIQGEPTHAPYELSIFKRNTNGGAGIPGAVMLVEGTGAHSGFSRQVTTGAGGRINVELPGSGQYQVTELQPPPGFLPPDNPVQNVNVVEGESAQVTFFNAPEDGGGGDEDDKYFRVEWEIEVETETTFTQSTEVEYSQGRGQLVIRKQDQYGDPLSGAVFDIRIDFSDGSFHETQGWVVDNGARLLTWTHPAGNIDAARVTVTEVIAPPGHTINANPVRVIDIEPSYTMWTIITHWEETVTSTTHWWVVIEIRNGEESVVDRVQDGPATHERTRSEWNRETHAYDRVGDLERDVLFVNEREHGRITIIKRDLHTGERLEGATYRISWNNGAAFRDVTTGANGEVLVTGLEDGWHSIVEQRPPTGYLLNPEPIHILLGPGEHRTVEVFNEKIPTLAIFKVCSVTGNSLPQARFQIERITDTGVELVGVFTSDTNGEILLENIEPGRFRISEVAPAPGYIMDQTVHEVTIAAGQRYELTITNTPRAPILIRKVDPQGNPLLGAEFTVTTMNGAHVATVQSAHTGFAIVPNVQPGWYIVSEVRSPEGHILSSTPQNVEVFAGQPATVTFVNHPYPILQIAKVDADDGRPLLGATFRIAEANGRFVGERTTGPDGMIILTDLPPGAYVVSEIRSADGYILDATPQTVTLEPGKTARLEFRNTSIPGLQLIKLDTETDRPVEGAMFDVTELQGGFKKSLGTFTTGTNGTFFIPDLTPGHFVITEVRAAPGYILDQTPQNVFIEGGRINVVQFFNTPYSNLRLLKIDSETRKPLADAIFRLYDERRREIGTYTTSALGEIYLTELPAGTYFLQEVRAPTGYLLDTTVRQIELEAGQRTTLEWPNTPLGSLRLIKVDADTRQPLFGVEFELLDARNNILGRFTTDRDGVIAFSSNLAPGRYQVREVRAATGYLLDERPHSVVIREGETTEIVIENRLMVGRIQITKVSSGFNDLTKDREGAGLRGATFEIYNNRMELVDTITTEGRQGIATSKPLPLGVYGIVEVSSPDYFLTDREMFYAEIKIHDDLIRFRVLNDPVDLEVSVEKRGIAEVQPGNVMYYELRDIRNSSNVPLREFYLRDILPTEAVRLQKIWTGVWSERVSMELQIRTNLSPNLRTVRRNLLSTTNNEIDVSTLGLAGGEFVTEFRLVFGEVQPGFHETTAPRLEVRVLDTATHGMKFTNRVDVGGRYLDKWVYETGGWTTSVWGRPQPRGPLPRTGL